MALFGKKADKQKPGSVNFDSSDEAALTDQIDAWVSTNRPRLGEVLMELGIIEPGDVEEALRLQAEETEEARKALVAAAEAEGQDPLDPSMSQALVPVKPRVGEVLMRDGVLDEVSLAAALSRQFGVPLADLRVESPDPEAVQLVPEELAREHVILPLKFENDRLQVVTADPFDVEAIRAITYHVGKVALRIGARSEIERHLDRAYNVLSAADDHIRAFELSYDEPNQENRADNALQFDENAPVVQVVNRVITQAVRQRASDVHVEPTEDDVTVRYRIDGAMTDAIHLPQRMGPAVTSRIKVMSELNIVERRRPQDGQFGVSVDGRPIDFRVSIVPTVHGEKTVLRLLDKTKSLISLPDLGMNEEVVDKFTKIVSSPLGMLLCTGPTGSGKTTTLYATLNELRDPTKNIVTIEDPVEYQFAGITQMPVTGSGITFADGLRGILRQDPDTILVGEIRDEETARIAMQAALTGHFVLSSLHAVDAVAAVHRFTDMGIEPFLVASALSGVVGQRLLRRNCTGCAESYTPSASESRMLERYSNLTPVWTKGAGCELCSGTGYRGRVGVYELLVFTDTIRDLVVAKATHHEIKAVAIEEGMRTMQQEAFDLVAKGLTTVDDVLRSVYAAGMDSDAAPVGELEQGKSELPVGKRAISGLQEDSEMDDDSLRDSRGELVVDRGGAIPTGPSTVGASASGEGES
ncbi:MAG: Flp pilus assembly complex ATPase component TadA [Microthrixaceae bacterium]|nr:Flp pilus assembly complex ATPase component TadA [Microthrixaceae bacterium]